MFAWPDKNLKIYKKIASQTTSNFVVRAYITNYHKLVKQGSSCHSPYWLGHPMNPYFCLEKFLERSLLVVKGYNEDN